MDRCNLGILHGVGARRLNPRAAPPAVLKNTREDLTIQRQPNTRWEDNGRDRSPGLFPSSCCCLILTPQVPHVVSECARERHREINSLKEGNPSPCARGKLVRTKICLRKTHYASCKISRGLAYSRTQVLANLQLQPSRPTSWRLRPV